MRKRFIALKTLYFMNGVQFIRRGKIHSENEYLFAKVIIEYDSGLKFKDVDGNTITLSNDPQDKHYYQRLFKPYETFRLE